MPNIVHSFVLSNALLAFIIGAVKIIAFALALLFLTGCSVIKELKKPPFPMAVIHHTRAVGIEAAVPNQAGDSIVKFRLGWFSDTTSLIPCATNPLHIVKISDTFKLGNTFSLSPSTQITEDLVTGWTDAPPPARHLKLFGPVETTNSTPKTNMPFRITLP